MIPDTCDWSIPEFSHTGDLGDVVFGLAAIRALLDMSGKERATLYLLQQHGKKSSQTREPLTEARVAALMPLLKEQKWIDPVYVPDKFVDSFMVGFRDWLYNEADTLANAHLCTYRGKNAEYHLLDEMKWLDVEPVPAARFVYARSPRYHTSDNMWREIAEVTGRNAEFIGLPEEYAAFERVVGKGIPYRMTDNLLDVARVIAGCERFFGNQSCPLAIAIGLGKDSVMECSDWGSNNVAGFRRMNLHRVTPGGHGPFAPPHAGDDLGDCRFLVALQYWKGDVAEAEKLAETLVANEDRFRIDVGFLDCPRHDTPSNRVADILRRRFPVMSLACMGIGETYPVGANELWVSTMFQLARMPGLADGVMTIEPDSLPLRKDWLDTMIREWEERGRGVLAVGHIFDSKGQGQLHMNGNGIFHREILDRLPQLRHCPWHRPWDGHHAKVFLKHGRHTDNIVQLYGWSGPWRLPEIRVASGAAWMHGTKTPSYRSNNP